MAYRFRSDNSQRSAVMTTEKVQAGCVQPLHAVSSPLRYALFGVELTLSFGVLLIALLFPLLLYRTTTMNLNPKILLMNLFLSGFIVASTRFILVGGEIFGRAASSNAVLADTTVIQWLHDVAVNVNTLNELALTIECTISSLFIHQSFTSHLAFSGLTLAWPWLTTILFQHLEKINVFDTILMFSIYEAVNLICCLTIALLITTTRIKYRRIETGQIASKYRVILNIRTLRTLNILSVITVIRNFVTMTLLIVIIVYVKPRCDYYMYLLLSNVYDLCVAVYSFLLPIPIVLSHEGFRKQLRAVLPFRHKLRRLTQVGPDMSKCSVNFVWSKPSTIALMMMDGEPMNALGERLIVKQGVDQYFRKLQQSWIKPAPVAGIVQIN